MWAYQTVLPNEKPRANGAVDRVYHPVATVQYLLPPENGRRSAKMNLIPESRSSGRLELEVLVTCMDIDLERDLVCFRICKMAATVGWTESRTYEIGRVDVNYNIKEQHYGLPLKLFLGYVD